MSHFILNEYWFKDDSVKPEMKGMILHNNALSNSIFFTYEFYKKMNFYIKQIVFYFNLKTAIQIDKFYLLHIF